MNTRTLEASQRYLRSAEARRKRPAFLTSPMWGGWKRLSAQVDVTKMWNAIILPLLMASVVPGFVAFLGVSFDMGLTRLMSQMAFVIFLVLLWVDIMLVALCGAMLLTAHSSKIMSGFHKVTRGRWDSSRLEDERALLMKCLHYDMVDQGYVVVDEMWESLALKTAADYGRSTAVWRVYNPETRETQVLDAQSLPVGEDPSHRYEDALNAYGDIFNSTKETLDGIKNAINRKRFLDVEEIKGWGGAVGALFVAYICSSYLMVSTAIYAPNVVHSLSSALSVLFGGAALVSITLFSLGYIVLHAARELDITTFVHNETQFIRNEKSRMQGENRIHKMRTEALGSTATTAQ